MRKFHKLTAVLLALCLTAAVLPPACFAAGGQTHTLPNLGDLDVLIDSSQVSDGDTIVLEGSGVINHGSDGRPWVISKSVTIQGGSVTLRAYGIILDADVTFQNTDIILTAATRNAIFANGHTLTLENVTSSGSSYPIDLFCGGVIDSYNEGFPNPSPGDRGVLNISGATRLSLDKDHLGNLYAGNFSAGTTGEALDTNVFGGSAEINIEGYSSDSWALGSVYACGAKQFRSPVAGGGSADNLTHPAQPNQNSTVSGGVSVNGLISDVQGVEGTPVNVTSRNNGQRNINVKNITSLTAAAGSTALDAGSTFQSGSANITVSSGATLDLTEFTGILDNFNGGGRLVLGEDQTLNITGTVSGTTSVGIGSITYNGESGSVPKEDHPYIITDPGIDDSAFTLLPYSTQPDAVLSKDAAGNWTVTGGGAVDPDKIISFSFDTKSVNAELETEAVIPISVTADQAFAYMDFIPLEIYVNGSTKSADLKIDDGTYIYTTSNPKLEMSVSTNEFCVTAYEEGTFTIRVVVPAQYSTTGVSLEDTFTLQVGNTVTPPDPSVTAIQIKTPANKTVYTLGEPLDVTGLTLEAALSDGSTQIVPVTADMVGGFRSDQAAERLELTISYGGQTVVYEVKVEDSGSQPPAGQTYQVEVVNSRAAVTGAGTYRPGDTVTVHAGVYNGYEFAAWDPTGVTLPDRTAADASFTMPANDVSLLAVWSISNHTHAWRDEWSSNGTHHWHNCSEANCPITQNSDKQGYGAHTAGDWIVDQPASPTQEGSRHRVCVTCGYLMARETIPATGGGSTGGGSTGGGTTGGGSTGGGSTGGGSTGGGSTGGGSTGGGSTGGSSTGGSSSGGSSSGGSSSGGSSYDSVISGSSSGFGSGAGETVKNPDGSTTTTSTNKATGTVRETVKRPDGSRTVVETSRDGVVTTTDTAADGSTVKVVSNTDGSSQTEVRRADGASASLTADASGQSRGEVRLPAKIVRDALNAGGVVSLPVSAVSAAGGHSTTLTVRTGSPRLLRVSIPVQSPTPGTVAVLVSPDGTETILKDAVADSIVVSAADGTVVKVLDNSKDFSDSRGHWAEDSIDFVTARELFTGRSTSSFGPDAPMTREMLATVLARLNGADTSGGGVYEKGMRWAVSRGISDGRSPDAWITREQIAVMLYRSAGEPAVGRELAFADGASVSGYAVKAVRWAVERGILTGYPDGTLAPQRDATRAQVAAMLARYIRSE